MQAKLRGRPAHVNNRDRRNLEKILEVLYGGPRLLITHSGELDTYLNGTGSGREKGRSRPRIATHGPQTFPARDASNALNARDSDTLVPLTRS